MTVPLRLKLPPDPASVRIARLFTANMIGQWIPPRRPADVLIVVSELVENAVQHTHRPCLLEVRRDGAVLEVSVTDWSCEPIRADAQNGHLEHRGRGLLMVNNLSESWGVRPIDGNGKVVWARIPAGPEKGGLRRLG